MSVSPASSSQNFALPPKEVSDYSWTELPHEQGLRRFCTKAIVTFQDEPEHQSHDLAHTGAEDTPTGKLSNPMTAAAKAARAMVKKLGRSRREMVVECLLNSEEGIEKGESCGLLRVYRMPHDMQEIVHTKPPSGNAFSRDGSVTSSAFSSRAASPGRGMTDDRSSVVTRQSTIASELGSPSEADSGIRPPVAPEHEFGLTAEAAAKLRPKDIVYQRQFEELLGFVRYEVGAKDTVKFTTVVWDDVEVALKDYQRAEAERDAQQPLHEPNAERDDIATIDTKTVASVPASHRDEDGDAVSIASFGREKHVSFALDVEAGDNDDTSPSRRASSAQPEHAAPHPRTPSPEPRHHATTPRESEAPSPAPSAASTKSVVEPRTRIDKERKYGDIGLELLFESPSDPSASSTEWRLLNKQMLKSQMKLQHGGSNVVHLIFSSADERNVWFHSLQEVRSALLLQILHGKAADGQDSSNSRNDEEIAMRALQNSRPDPTAIENFVTRFISYTPVEPSKTQASPGKIHAASVPNKGIVNVVFPNKLKKRKLEYVDKTGTKPAMLRVGPSSLRQKVREVPVQDLPLTTLLPPIADERNRKSFFLRHRPQAGGPLFQLEFRAENVDERKQWVEWLRLVLGIKMNEPHEAAEDATTMVNMAGSIRGRSNFEPPELVSEGDSDSADEGSDEEKYELVPLGTDGDADEGEAPVAPILLEDTVEKKGSSFTTREDAPDSDNRKVPMLLSPTADAEVATRSGTSPTDEKKRGRGTDDDPPIFTVEGPSMAPIPLSGALNQPEAAESNSLSTKWFDRKADAASSRGDEEEVSDSSSDVEESPLAAKTNDSQQQLAAASGETKKSTKPSKWSALRGTIMNAAASNRQTSTSMSGLIGRPITSSKEDNAKALEEEAVRRKEAAEQAAAKKRERKALKRDQAAAAQQDSPRSSRSNTIIIDDSEDDDLPPPPKKLNEIGVQTNDSTETSPRRRSSSRSKKSIDAETSPTIVLPPVDLVEAFEAGLEMSPIAQRGLATREQSWKHELKDEELRFPLQVLGVLSHPSFTEDVNSRRCATLVIHNDEEWISEQRIAHFGQRSFIHLSTSEVLRCERSRSKRHHDRIKLHLQFYGEAPREHWDHVKEDMEKHDTKKQKAKEKALRHGHKHRHRSEGEKALAAIARTFKASQKAGIEPVDAAPQPLAPQPQPTPQKAYKPQAIDDTLYCLMLLNDQLREPLRVDCLSDIDAEKLLRVLGQGSVPTVDWLEAFETRGDLSSPAIPPDSISAR